jgi:ParB-like chromosome segregation protein Spo0J
MTAITDAAPDADEAEDTRERVTVWDTGEVLYVHPVASLFPMMSDEELDDLAEDIRQNGQADPIVRDSHDQLIDGRNRLEACRRVEVSPDIRRVDLEDPVAYILSKNVSRRHLTKGQQAMSVARAVRFQIETSRRGTVLEYSAAWGLHKSRVSQAFTILEYAPEYADAVLFRGVPLSEALGKAQARKAAAQSDEARLEALKVEAPDLAELVVDERLTLAEAGEALGERRRKAAEREKEERERRQTTTNLVVQALTLLDPGQLSAEQRAAALRDRLDPALLQHAGVLGSLSTDRLLACRAVLDALIAALGPGRDGPQEAPQEANADGTTR